MKKQNPESEDVKASDDSKITFVASSSNIDRYGDVINQKGWSLDNYKKNPVVLLNHDSNQLPIGKGNVYLRNDQLVIDVQFDTEDTRAKEVKRKAEKGYMNAVSVGFRPIESMARADLEKDHPHYGQRGMYYTKQELLEVSIVTIPANGEATMLKNMKMEMLEEIKSYIDSQLVVNKHILSVREEDDKYIVEFAKVNNESSMDDEEEKEMEEEEEKAMEEEEEKEMEEEEEKEMEEEEEEKYNKDEDEEKDFKNIIEAFAYILTK